MADKDKLADASGSHLVPQDESCPLFIEEDEEYFEDCLEEMEAALSLPRASINYSQECQEAMQAEFNGLMRQMLAQLDEFEATHETQSATPTYLTECEDILLRNGFQHVDSYDGSIAENAEHGSQGFVLELPELSTPMQIMEISKAFESCIEEVSQLQRRKEELVQELLELEKPMADEVQALRNELGEAQKLLFKTRLEKQNLQDDIRVFKKRLFSTARDCAQSQMALLIQQKEVEQLNQEQDEMKTHIVHLTEVICKLQSEHQSQVHALQTKRDIITQEGSKDKAHSYLSQGRRASMDLQQFLQGGIKALEEWYEPRLVALLKRRQNSAETLSKYKEQCQELKTQLGPLKDEERRLGLEKARLEERICLMERQRKENVEQYRETIDRLEESSRQLKTELQIQINKIKEMEALKNSLAKQLFFYRECTEVKPQETMSMEEKT